MKVRDVLKTKGERIITIEPGAMTPDAVARMVENNIGSLPVVDREGRLVGVLSERDLIRELHDRGDQFAASSIEQVMTLDPITCDIDDEVEAVMGLMSEKRIAKVPITERGRLVGIVSVGDVIKTLYARTKDENHHLMGYLYGPVAV
jgi:CBS domain-containing protein